MKFENKLNQIQKFWLSVAEDMVNRHIESIAKTHKEGNRDFIKTEREAIEEIIQEKPMQEWIDIILTEIDEKEKFKFSRDREDENKAYANIWSLYNTWGSLRPNRFNARQLAKLTDSIWKSFDFN